MDDDSFATSLRQGAVSSRAPRGGWVLIVTAGPDTGKRLALDGRSFPHALIGLSPACDLQLRDPLVSRRHAAIDVGDRVRVTDLRSTNGTFVNGVSIGRAYLGGPGGGGETIKLGDSELRLYPAPEVPDAAVGENEPLATGFGPLLGASPEMRLLYPRLAKLAASDIPVVVEGETGTGKEVVAEALHAASAREKGPFVVFDCTTVPSSLFEAELFGHERGAFTGAVTTRKGMFEEAEGGTLLIDEIGDLDLPIQARLLRALDQREVRRVGGNRWTKVDVRVLAATRRDLDRMVQEGRFRDDLFYRLAVGRIELPALRDRRGDVAFLATHFWRALGGDGGEQGMPPAPVLDRWEQYDWPGNVRELYNAVVREVALGEGTSAVLGGSSVPRPSRPGTVDVIGDVIAEGLPFARARKRVQEAFVERYVETILVRHGGNVSVAARESGLARRYFQLLRSKRR